MQQLLDNLFYFEDTCNVYVIRSGDSAVLVDFGSGDVLDHLDEIGVARVTDVMITHHHRDQCQGLARAVEMGIHIYVPHTEQDLFQFANEHWQAREILNNYNMRQDRFSLLESVAIDGTLQDYEVRQFGDHTFTVVPTPGHTIGSLTLMSEIDGTRCAFAGDLIAAPGQVWSLAATQWTYNGAEGAAASVPSLLDLKERQPDLLLPSHGEVMDDPAPAIDLLVERLWQLLQLRRQNLRIFELRDKPYEPITPHLLRHRASMANTYVVLSESGKALLIDFGYDFMTGFTAGYDRASRRPWLYTIPALKRQFGIDQIDVVLPTHFHDDHVAGINLLRRVEGTKVWAADLFADILEHPTDYDLPCLWYDPIPVDKALPLETPIQWEEYTFTLYALPGHTRYAVAIAFEVDGKRILATGDQYQGDAGLELNYVYPNRFQAADYIKSAALYARLKPDIILTGHWMPLHVPPDYFGKLAMMGGELERLHRELLAEKFDLGEEGFLARIMPYQVNVPRGEAFTVRVEVRNPFRADAEATIKLVVPEGWHVTGGDTQTMKLGTPETTLAYFEVLPLAETAERRARIGADVTINGQRFGEQAEALVTTT
ncbi:MAG: MBL fold metallo-hydrolase [Anaerolineae bacterium]|nr:MBL fold metallo-hydrolase [Anaerolineae bacterium]